MSFLRCRFILELTPGYLPRQARDKGQEKLKKRGSFLQEVKTFPKLWDAAYSDQERYTQADLASMIEYARLRGVRVMVEFDVPGHAQSWCKGYPEVCTACEAQKGSTLPLNPSRNATFELMASLLGEMTGGSASTAGSPSGLFPLNMIHLGGDEVDTDCFNRDPEIAAWMAGRGAENAFLSLF